MQGEGGPGNGLTQTPKPAKPSVWRRLWLPLVLLIAGAYLFWVLPAQLGDQPVRVEFEAGPP
jgi:hypothetical protein